MTTMHKTRQRSLNTARKTSPTRASTNTTITTRLRRLALACCTVALLSTPVGATPVSPLVVNMTSQFSVDVQRRFHLFADSHDSQLVWYVPKIGGIRNVAGAPALQVISSLIDGGPFSGMQALKIAGEFSTAGLAGDITLLQQDAARLGLRIQAAAATAANTQIMLGGFAVDSSGQMEASCSTYNLTTPTGVVEVPICQAKNAQGVWQDIDFMGAFQATLPVGGSSVSQQIPFSGFTLPGWEGVFNELLRYGSSWDGQIQLVTDWTLQTQLTLKDAEYQVDWRPLYQFLVAQARSRGWRLSAAQVTEILGQAIIQRKGISISYVMDNQSLAAAPKHDVQHQRVINSIIHQLRKQLFTPVRRLRLSIRDLASLNDPINPLMPFVAPTYAELQRKWGSGVERVVRRVPYYRDRDRYYDVDTQAPDRLDDSVLPLQSDVAITAHTDGASTWQPLRYYCQELPYAMRFEPQTSTAPLAQAVESVTADMLRPNYIDCEPPLPPEPPEPIEPPPPSPPPPPPPPQELMYVLKSNYLFLRHNSSTRQSVFVQDIEQTHVSTLMTVDCVSGAIDQPLVFAPDAACAVYGGR